jgi:hypothetical protein
MHFYTAMNAKTFTNEHVQRNGKREEIQSAGVDADKIGVGKVCIGRYMTCSPSGLAEKETTANRHLAAGTHGSKGKE